MYQLVQPKEPRTQGVLEEIQRLYTLRQREQVQKFLTTHPELLTFLLEAYPRAQKYFGSNTQIALEVMDDPEIPMSDELFAYIRTSLPVGEALIRLDKLENEWF